MKRRWSNIQVVRVASDDSSSEVTSSSATLVMSPADSLASTDIGDVVELGEFWDLDINEHNHTRGVHSNGYAGHTVITTNSHSKSDTSSMSGRSKT